MWANDFEPDVETTYRHNFPNVSFLSGDINEIDPKALEPVDIVHGGFPCQASLMLGRERVDDPKGVGKLFDVMMDKLSCWIGVEDIGL